MPTEIYEVVAQGARYWFLFLMLLIVWRSYRWLAKDRRQRRKRARLLPDAGFVGEMVVVKGNDQLSPGETLPVPMEGTLGFTRMNDLCVPVAGVKKRHCWLCYEPEEGLLVEPCHGCAVTVDGQAPASRREPLPMGHGSRLAVGEAELRLRLFAGYETAASARERAWEDEGEKQPPQAAAMTPAQLALWQQQALWQAQQQAIQQQQYAQWLAAQAAAAAQQPEDIDGENRETLRENASADWASNEAVYENDQVSWEKDEAQEYESLPGDEPDDLRGAASAPSPGSSQIEFAPCQPVYPPEVSEQPEDVPWPPAFQPEEQDEDMTDAAAPPKSAYVGHDEAERAKRLFWDKYLGGGDRR